MSNIQDESWTPHTALHDHHQHISIVKHRIQCRSSSMVFAPNTNQWLFNVPVSQSAREEERIIPPRLHFRSMLFGWMGSSLKCIMHGQELKNQIVFLGSGENRHGAIRKISLLLHFQWDVRGQQIVKREKCFSCGRFFFHLQPFSDSFIYSVSNPWSVSLWWDVLMDMAIWLECNVVHSEK